MLEGIPLIISALQTFICSKENYTFDPDLMQKIFLTAMHYEIKVEKAELLLVFPYMETA